VLDARAEAASAPAAPAGFCPLAAGGLASPAPVQLI